MNLEYIEETRAFVLRVPRTNTPLVRELVQSHGWDMSLPRSTVDTALMFTTDAYAAAAFTEIATAEAREQLAPIAREVAKSWATESKANIASPAGTQLWPFQKAGVEFCMQRSHSLIGDSPGLGKTAQAICVANEMKAKRILVICPAAIRLQWIAKIREWTTLPWPYVLHPILKAGHGVHPNAHYTVVSYELASTAAIGAALADRTYDLLILDEAHYLKTIDTRRTRAIFGGGKDRKFEPLASRAGAVVALTGTPLPNRPREAYTLARGLCHEAIDFMSEQGFKDRYNPSMQITHNGKIVANREESGRSFELQNRLRAHFMVRREKHGERGVMKQLVLPVYDIVQLEKTGPVKLALEAESMLHLDPETLSGADAKILGHVAEVRRLMGVALAPQVADYADMLIDGGEEKLVIFGWHTEVLDILQQKLAKHGVVRIDGSTSARRRQENVAAFQHNPRIKVIIGNMLAMGVGVDGLQHCCSHVLLAEPDWVPGNNVQAIDRLDRGGQKRQVQADIFVAPGSFAERILASALRKMQTIHKSLDARVQKIW